MQQNALYNLISVRNDKIYARGCAGKEKMRTVCTVIWTVYFVLGIRRKGIWGTDNVSLHIFSVWIWLLYVDYLSSQLNKTTKILHVEY